MSLIADKYESVISWIGKNPALSFWVAIVLIFAALIL